MKFSHKFTLQNSSGSCRYYKCGSTNAYIDFVNESCIRVAMYRDGCKILPSFNINPSGVLSQKGRGRLDTEGFPLSTPIIKTESEQEHFTLENGIEITLSLNNFLLSCYDGEKKLFSDRKPLAYNIQNEFGKGVYHYISRSENERIFGLGDKGGKLNKAGRSFRIEATDCMGYDAKSTDPLYKHIPFYICENENGCYGIFYDTSDTSYIDLGREIDNYYEPYKYFKSEDDCLVYYVFFGTKHEIIKNFGSLCGKQAFPPKWSFNYCASTMAYTDAPDSEEKMYQFLDTVKELDLECSGFYLSSGYTSIGENRYVFNWNRDKFKNPEKFISDFSDNGIEIIPNIKPAFLTTHPMYDELKEKGYFIKNPDGTSYVTQFWDGFGSYLDFNNEKAFDFWGEQVEKKLLDLGIKATWNDNNEFDIKDGDIIERRMRPSLTYLMVLSSYLAQTKKYPSLRPFLSTRSGGIGVRRLAQTWSGDNRTEFKDLRYCHNIGLTLSMSGLYFYGHDLGGFTGNAPSRELLLRWLQHGVFEPRFTIHSWNADGSATMPWTYPDILPSVKALFEERKRLLPYLYNCAYNAVEKEIPINAPLILYYEDAPTECDCLMLGKDILAPFIFDEGEDKTRVYLPKGDNWYKGNRLYEGGQEVDVEIPVFSPSPYFVKSASVIPTLENGEVVLTVYPQKNGCFESEYFDDDGISFEYKNKNCTLLKMSIECNENEVIIHYKNEGKILFKPTIKLVSSDKRQLIINGDIE